MLTTQQRSKLTIDQIGQLLSLVGYTLGAGSTAINQSGAWVTEYRVTRSDGVTRTLETHEIIELLAKRNAI